MLLDGLYTVISQTPQRVSVHLSDRSHSVFQAHFPENPILPGFVHLEIIEDVFSLKIQGIKKAKFTQIVLPEQILEYVMENKKIVVTCQEKEVAQIIIII